MGLIVGAFVVTILIAVNALYVAAEFGAVSARRSRIRQLAEEGHWLARRLAPVLANPSALDRWIAASQIGITISSLVLGAYGEAKLAPVLEPFIHDLLGLGLRSAHTAAWVIVLIALTVMQMILGELIPKSFALQFPTHTALYTALPMRWSLRVLSVFIRVLNGSGHLILRLMGVSQPDHHHVHAPEEIDILIRESTHGGQLDPREREQLRRALGLAVREARQMMVPREKIHAIEVGASSKEVLRAISGAYTRVPVFRGRFDNMVGVLLAKDVVVQQLEDGRVRSVGELMQPVLHVPEDIRAGRLLSLLRENQTRIAIVKDARGYIVGLITVQDVLASVLGAVPVDPPPRRPVRTTPERKPISRLWRRA